MIDFKIKVCDKIIQFKTDDTRLEYDVYAEREFTNFIYEGEARPDLALEIKYGMMPEFPGKEVKFNVDKSWFLSKHQDNMLFEYPDRNLPGRIERAAEIKKDLKSGTIYVNREKTPEEEEETKRLREMNMTEDQRQRIEERQKKSKERKTKKAAEGVLKQAPTLTLEEKEARKKKKQTPGAIGKKIMAEIKANFFQAFLVEYVIQNEIGFMAHCSAVYYDDKLYLFMGQSGAGKSTIAEIFHDFADATVFNDDRAVLTFKDGKVIYNNAPWAGTLMNKCALGTGSGTEIEAVFFIYQNPENIIKETNKANAAAKIFRNSFPVFWRKDAILYTLGVCSKIASKARCFDLGFINNKTVINCIKNGLNVK